MAGEWENLERLLEQRRDATAELPRDLQARLLATTGGLLSGLRPVRRAPGPAVCGAATAGLMMLVAAIGVWRLGTAGFGALNGMERVVFFSLLLAAVGLTSVTYGQRLAPGSLMSVSLAPRAGGLALVLGILVLTLFQRHYAFNLWPSHERCFLNGLLLSSGAFVAGALVQRIGFWADRRKAITNLAGVAVATALLVLTTYCPIQNSGHVFLAHWGSLALVFAMAWLVSTAWAMPQRPARAGRAG